MVSDNYPDEYELAEFTSNQIKYNAEKWRYSLDPRDPDYLEKDEEE